MQKRHCRLSSVNESKNDSIKIIFSSTFLTSDHASNGVSSACGAYTSCGRPCHLPSTINVNRVLARLYSATVNASTAVLAVTAVGCDEENFKHHGILKGTTPTSSQMPPPLPRNQAFLRGKPVPIKNMSIKLDRFSKSDHFPK